MKTLFDLNLKIGDEITVNRRTYEVIGVTSTTIGLRDKKGKYQPEYVSWPNPLFNGKITIHRKGKLKKEQVIINN